MYKEEILNKYFDVLPSKPSWIVIHSSIFHLNVKHDDFKWEMLKAIKALVDKGHTLAFPAFTFSFCSTGVFNPHTSKSEVGILADWVLTLYDSIRTDHPIYSHVIIGPEAKQAMSISTISCFGNDSIYSFFENKNAIICMLGCSWASCTTFHYFEEKYKVPYRYYKTFTSKDSNSYKAKMFVRNLIAAPKNDFYLAITALKNKIEKTTFGSGNIETITFKEMSLVCKNQLTQNLFCYLSNAKQTKLRISQIVESTSSENIKIAMLAESNFDQLGDIFKDNYQTLCPMREIDFYQNPYGQMSTDVYSGKIQKIKPDYCILPSRLEDIYKVSNMEFANINDISPIENYINLIKVLNDQVKRKVFVHLFPIIGQSTLGAVQFENYISTREIIDNANSLILDKIKDLNNVKIITPEMMGVNILHSDLRSWYLGRIPYGIDIFKKFSENYCGYILNDLGKTVRLIILDLDNTLWGGVIGEEGASGILLGGDFPGNAFKDFQKTIISLKERGIALAIASKNDEDLVLKTIEEHPEMQIRTNDLASYRINWTEKYINIKEIASEIGLSLSNVMFVDDNSIECEKVRVNLPEVKVIELPSDPVLYRQTLLNSPYLAVSEITNEDKNRSTSYLKNRLMKEEQEKYEDIESFFISLDIEVQINKLDEHNFSRSLQLINKTNQFNTTAKRYTEQNLKYMLNSDKFVIGVIGYADKVTDFENIGLFILEKKGTSLNIGSFLLSCRILGRNIENVIIAWIIKYSLINGSSLLTGEIIETVRNTPVRDLYNSLGFEQEKFGLWKLGSKSKVKIPSWIKVGGNLSNEK
ncbi:MAG: FkbH-like protein [Colwellia sp.]|jgi:FkbH-like protein